MTVTTRLTWRGTRRIQTVSLWTPAGSYRRFGSGGFAYLSIIEFNMILLLELLEVFCWHGVVKDGFDIHGLPSVFTSIWIVLNSESARWKLLEIWNFRRISPWLELRNMGPKQRQANTKSVSRQFEVDHLGVFQNAILIVFLPRTLCTLYTDWPSHAVHPSERITRLQAFILR